MPTGYTSPIVDSSTPITLRQYVLRCARAFGACVELHDESLDTPLPKSFKPSSYHRNAANKARATVKRLSKMTKVQRVVYNKTEQAQMIKMCEDYIAKSAAENKRYYDMRALVEAWAPAPEIIELKSFMLQQIDLSIEKDDYWNDQLAQAKETDYYTVNLAAAKRDIKYHTQEYAKEIERINQRNLWLKTLRNSLPAI